METENPPCVIPSMLVILLLGSSVAPINGENATAVKIDVGVILNLDTTLGKMRKTCIMMAIEDFNRGSYSTKIVPHIRDSKSDAVEAASKAIDLLKNVKVQAIVGPDQSSEADFVADIGTKVKVPMLSPATSPSLSCKENPYFVRVAHKSSSQAEDIASIIRDRSWREVALVSQDNDFGRGLLPSLADALLEVGTKVQTQTVLSPSDSDDVILSELQNLKSMQTRVFIVHMLPNNLTSRLFLKAKEAGMMSEGYVWIITDVLTILLSNLDPKVIDSMEGVIGLRPQVPSSNRLENFKRRWELRFYKENPDIGRIDLNVFGLWAHDSIVALAEAIGKSGITSSSHFKKPTAGGENWTDLDTIGTSVMGPKLLESIQNIEVNGLSGPFHIVRGQLKPTGFQMINIIKNGKIKEIHGTTDKIKIGSNHKSIFDYQSIRWPGNPNEIPKGWEIPRKGEKLKVRLPFKEGFREFINIEKTPKTNADDVSGFCGYVFKEVIKLLPYNVSYEISPFSIKKGEYDELVQSIRHEEYDMAIGDITITADRSKYADFTQPFTESGVSIIVPVEPDERKTGWIFTKPVKGDLFGTTVAFFLSTGVVVWVLEHRVNKEFRGPPSKQFGTILWYSFSTLVYAHKENVTSNLTRFVVIVWVFAVLVLSSSYTASLTSMLTVKSLQPTVTNINDLFKSGEPVGYQKGSFVRHLLKSDKFKAINIKEYSTFEEYNEALTKGSQNGGVAAIVDEIPYIRLFLRRYRGNYTVIGPISKTAGFGFALPQGSPLLGDVSRAILKLRDSEVMKNITERWLEKEAECAEQHGAVPERLALDNFWGLFLIAGTSSTAALIIFVFTFLDENREILFSVDRTVWEKLVTLAKTFDSGKEILNNDSNHEMRSDDERASISADRNVVDDQRELTTLDYQQSPATVIISHNIQGSLSEEEALPTTETANSDGGTITIELSNGDVDDD